MPRKKTQQGESAEDLKGGGEESAATEVQEEPVQETLLQEEEAAATEVAAPASADMQQQVWYASAYASSHRLLPIHTAFEHPDHPSTEFGGKTGHHVHWDKHYHDGSKNSILTARSAVSASDALRKLDVMLAEHKR